MNNEWRGLPVSGRVGAWPWVHEAANGGTLRFIANSRRAEGITRDQLVRYFADHEIDSSTWDLVRHHTVTEYAFKVGASPGIVIFVEADSEVAAAEVVNGLPVVERGFLVFEIDPVRPVAHF